MHIYRHFDPNDSGSIHYGEFVWGFFNHRNFIKQYKQANKKLTKKDIVNMFHKVDTNGNGSLNKKEFMKLLKLLHINLSESEVDMLMLKFDRDGDGQLDLEEFYNYIQEEVKDLDSTSKVDSNTKTTRGSNSSSRSNNGNSTSRANAGNTVSNSDGSTTRSASRGRALGTSSSNTRMRKSADFNQTAPAALQKSIESIGRNTSSSSSLVLEDAEEEEKVSGSGTSGSTAESINRSKEDEELWMTRMLKAQSDIESRLGRKYYKTTTI
jgi:hypothetical protein